MEPAGEQMTLFSLAGSRDPASHTALPGSDKEKKMSATSGPKCLESFERFAPHGLWAKTFPALLIGQEGWYSRKCNLTWKLRATKFNRMYFQLAVSMPRTGGKGSGLLPMLQTPTTTERSERPEEMRERAERKGYKNGTKYNSLKSQILYDPQILKLLPTPTAVSDAKGGCTRTDPKRQNDTLAHSIHGKIGETGKTSQLNHRFVMEMMGFPPDWCDIYESVAEEFLQKKKSTNSYKKRLAEYEKRQSKQGVTQ